MAAGAVIVPPLVDWAHRTIGRNRGEVSDLDFEAKNLDFTAVGRRGTLDS
jgi:hypothetical protein